MLLPRHAELWLPGYIRDRARRLAERAPHTVWVSITDHYEPYWHNTDDGVARDRVALWRERWPSVAARHADSTGRRPQYCFFYPEEEYRPWLLDSLAEIVRQGLGDVEIHIHHDADTEEGFVRRMTEYLHVLHGRHGLLRQEGGQIRFGFIHGNWALDNSRNGQWCGLNNEITLLKRMGCYADFTMPSGASPTQARLLNRIYWAVDDPARPKSYDRGVPVEEGSPGQGDLLIVPGPFGLRWSGRLIPRLETGELAAYDPPDERRVRRWLALAPRVGGHAFVKLFSHGTQEKNSRLLFQGGLDDLFSAFERETARLGIHLRYVTAWEMRRAIDCAARGETME